MVFDDGDGDGDGDGNGGGVGGADGRDGRGDGHGDVVDVGNDGIAGAKRSVTRISSHLDSTRIRPSASGTTPVSCCS